MLFNSMVVTPHSLSGKQSNLISPKPYNKPKQHTLYNHLNTTTASNLLKTWIVNIIEIATAKLTPLTSGLPSSYFMDNRWHSSRQWVRANKAHQVSHRGLDEYRHHLAGCQNPWWAHSHHNPAGSAMGEGFYLLDHPEKSKLP